MEALINNLKQWLKRNKVDDTPEDSGGVRRKREKYWYNKEKVDPVCIFRTVSKLRDFTTVRRPDKNKVTLKEQYEHTKDNRFYKHIGDEYPLHVSLGHGTYCRIRTEEVYKGQPGEPIVEGTTFGRVIHGGNDSDSQSFFSRDTSDFTTSTFCGSGTGVRMTSLMSTRSSKRTR